VPSKGEITLGMSQPINSLDELWELLITINNQVSEINSISLERFLEKVIDSIQSPLDQIHLEKIDSLIDWLQDAV
jgi:hypothetical protein